MLLTFQPQHTENEMKLSITQYGQTKKTAAFVLYDADRTEEDGTCKVLGEYTTQQQAVNVMRMVSRLPAEIADILPRMSE